MLTHVEQEPDSEHGTQPECDTLRERRTHSWQDSLSEQDTDSEYNTQSEYDIQPHHDTQPEHDTQPAEGGKGKEKTTEEEEEKEETVIEELELEDVEASEGGLVKVVDPSL
jgi:hypothetical protein